MSPIQVIKENTLIISVVVSVVVGTIIGGSAVAIQTNADRVYLKQQINNELRTMMTDAVSQSQIPVQIYNPDGSAKTESKKFGEWISILVPFMIDTIKQECKEPMPVVVGDSTSSTPR